jgi:hypothetical protein
MLNFVEMAYKHKLKKYNLTVADISKMFGAKNEISFRNSSAFNRYMKAFDELSSHIESEIIKKISQ